MTATKKLFRPEENKENKRVERLEYYFLYAKIMQKIYKKRSQKTAKNMDIYCQRQNAIR